ncbi:hypothetical protein ACFLR1_04380 [Bacteroidota bacterium]
MVVSGDGKEELMADVMQWARRKKTNELRQNTFPDWAQGNAGSKTLYAIWQFSEEIDPDDEVFRTKAFDWYAAQLNGLHSVFGELMQ